MKLGAIFATNALAELIAAPAHLPRSASDAVDSGETVILILRPSAWFIALSILPWVPWVAAGIVVLGLLSGDESIPWDLPHAIGAGFAVLGVRAVFQVIDWLGRWYVLTDRRLLVRARVPAQVTQMPLKEIARVDTVASRLERFLGVGMVRCWRHRSTDEPEMYWRVVRDPEAVRRQILEAMNRCQR